MGNSYLERLDAEYWKGIRAGLEIGLQIGCDMDVLCLRDKDVMGKDTFGADRVVRFVETKRDKMKQYEPAWFDSDEADYYQEKLDDNLREAFKGHLEFTFEDRHPLIKKQQYQKARKRKR